MGAWQTSDQHFMRKTKAGLRGCFAGRAQSGLSRPPVITNDAIWSRIMSTVFREMNSLPTRRPWRPVRLPQSSSWHRCGLRSRMHYCAGMNAVGSAPRSATLPRICTFSMTSG